MENMQQCNAEDTCRVGNLKKYRINKEKEEDGRKGLDPDNGGQISYQDKKNTKESVCLILAGMHLLAEI